MIEEVKDFYRKELFEHYNSCTNPFIIMTTKIWLSCQPWFQFNGFVPIFNRELSIPQFIWDKYENIDGKYYVDLMICVHHGFVDGFHIGQFLSKLEKNILAIS